MKKNLILPLLLFSSVLFAQEKTYTFTGAEIQRIYQIIDSLEKVSTTQGQKIHEYEFQIQQYKQKELGWIMKYDLAKEESELLRSQVKVYQSTIKDVSPKWWEKKGLWYTFGFLSSTLTVWAISSAL